MSPQRLNPEEVFEDRYTAAFKQRFDGRGVVEEVSGISHRHPNPLRGDGVSTGLPNPSRRERDRCSGTRLERRDIDSSPLRDGVRGPERVEWGAVDLVARVRIERDGRRSAEVVA